jgi:hypothetical protein
MNGKGDTYRKVDRKKYDKNYSKIFDKNILTFFLHHLFLIITKIKNLIFKKPFSKE